MTPLEEFYAAQKLALVGMAFGAILAVVGVGRMIAPGMVDWIQARRRVGQQLPWDDTHLLEVWEPVFEPGVAKVGGE